MINLIDSAAPFRPVDYPAHSLPDSLKIMTRRTISSEVLSNNKKDDPKGRPIRKRVTGIGPATQAWEA